MAGNRPPPPLVGKPIQVGSMSDVQRALRDLTAAVRDLQSRVLTDDQAIEVLSGSINSAIATDIATAVGFLTGSGITSVVHDTSLSGLGTLGTPLSALPTFNSLQAGVTSSLGSLYTSVTTGATSSLVGAYSSLQTGVTASVGAAYSVLQTAVTASNASVTGLSGTINSAVVSLSGTVDSGIKSLSGTINSRFLATAFNNTVTGTLDVTGSVKVTGSIQSTGPATFGVSVSTVTVNASIGSFAQVNATNVTTTSEVKAGNGAQVTGTLSVLGSFLLNGAPVAFNNTVTGTLDVTGSMKVTGSLNVSGKATAGSLLVNGQVSSLSVSTGDIGNNGAVSLRPIVAVTGNLDVLGQALVTGTLDVLGPTMFRASAQVTGTMDVTGTLSLSGTLNVRLGGNFGQGLQAPSFNGALGNFSTVSSGPGSFSGRLRSTGGTQVTGVLDVLGESKVTGTLSVNGVFILNGLDQTNLSGTIDSAIVSLSSTINSALGAGGSAAAVSSTLDAQRVHDGLDHIRGMQYFDDFLTSGLSGKFTAGVGSVVWQVGEPGHPGIVRLQGLTSGTDAAELIFTDSPNGVSQMTFGGGPIEYEACMRLVNLDDGTNNSIRRVGLHTNITTPLDGAWFEMNRSRFGDNEFRFITAATGSRAQQKTGVTVGNARWYRARISVAPNGDAVTGSLWCSGTLLSTVATRTFVTAAAVYAGGLYFIKTLGNTVTHVMDVDYQYVQQSFTGSRA